LCSLTTNDVVSKFSFFLLVDGRIRILEAQKLTDPDPEHFERLTSYLIYQFLKCFIPRGILCSLTTDDVLTKFRYGLRGYALALLVHGEHSEWADLWRDRQEIDEFDAAQLIARWK
jgi:hypothetical protein